MTRTAGYSRGRQIDILVMYQSSPTSYGIRLHSSNSGALQRVVGVVATLRDATVEPEAITCTEYDELAALRKAQAWGTPMFQPKHPRYAAAMTRLEQLKAKELSTSPSAPACSEQFRESQREEAPL
jgi:hypothetical protein